MVCDGKKDCSEGEDEDSSVCPEKCVYPNFKCMGSTLCLVPGKVCDGNHDCTFANATDRSDEDPMFCSKFVELFSPFFLPFFAESVFAFAASGHEFPAAC